MAKFLKIESSDDTNPEVFIGIDEITHIKRDATNPDTEIEIVYTGGTCTVTFTGNSANSKTPVNVLKAFNAALAANPGGVVSTVGKPLVTAQVIKDPAGNATIDGRMYIDAEAVYVTYTDVAFA
jgi:hypothetical protein